MCDTLCDCHPNYCRCYFSAGVIIFMNKPFTTLDEQIEILKSRRLKINNVEDAKSLLYRYGYYNIINAYKDLFLTNKNPDTFRTETEFSHLMYVFYLDRDYRHIILKNILNIENSLKAIISYEFANEFGSLGYNNANNFNIKNMEKVAKLQKRINSTISYALSDQKQLDGAYQCLIHAYKNHNEIPVWILFRVLTFGDFAMFYECLNDTTKTTICTKLSTIYKCSIDKRELYTMLKILTSMRNLCAHGQRIYNFTTRQSINIEKEYVQNLIKDIPNLDIHKLPVINLIFKQLLSEDDNRRYQSDVLQTWVQYRQLVPNKLFYELIDKIIGLDSFIKTTDMLLGS